MIRLDITVIALVAFLALEAKSYELSSCEQKNLKYCSTIFADVWKTGDENGGRQSLRSVYCKAFKDYAICLARNSCDGRIIDLLREGIVEHMIVNKKTSVCGDDDIISKLKSLTGDLDGVLDIDFSKPDLESLQVQSCDIRVNNACADFISKHLIQAMKTENKCLADAVDESIFNCYEMKSSDCDSQLYRRFLGTIERIGRIIMTAQKAKPGLLPYC